MRRPSLVDELREKDSQYVQKRINDVLKSLPDLDRDEILKDYHKDTNHGKDKPLLLASLIDSLYDRKGKNINVSLVKNIYY